ncbi:uncharacterized protein SPAPADRAFT_63360 [Spathaspora passalidarum NRRL Y-27907]|uniref:NAD(P)-binding protein n=1 Tax=Spathaspora passalidarum (strain NRRL Y-27907 / 11-Y1) TaxID=619300 RepID=G3AUF0_SPAPN|nr:uncharacterized protein SPAPADRAFT_63360 [Spathaspora passalidarum NRRL Y-27907]EGW30526.1 hypothetical protein SPAPADRAFT_63360 [Spathaspora passalidarum NRRL Y-27907]
MSDKINFAVVGTGIFATDTHLPTIQKIPELNPAAAYNRTKSKAEQFATKAGIPQDKVYDTLEEAFQDKTIDFVDALLPVQFNLDAVKLAIEHNKPLAFEKPIAANLTQAKEIVQLSEKTEVPIMILENWTYLSAIDILKNQVLPKIGEVVAFTYNATGPFHDTSKYLATGWRQKPEHIGGFLSDGGVHQLALLTEVLGEVESVSGLTKQLREQSGADDILFSTFKLKSGVIGTFTYGSAFGATDKSTSFTIFGTEGSAVYDWSPSLSKPTVTYQTGSTSSTASAKSSIEIDEINTIEAEFKNFRDVVKANDKKLVKVTPRKAFHHLAIVAAALESSKKNGTSVNVEIP